MADHTITVSNRMTFLGGDKATLWGAGNMTWGTDTWGAGSKGIEEVVEKLIAGSLASDSAEIKDIVFNGPIANTLSLTATTTEALERIIGNTLGLASDVVIELLSNGIWYYVFPGGVTNAENRIATSYSSATGYSTTYTYPSSPATSWS